MIVDEALDADACPFQDEDEDEYDDDCYDFFEEDEEEGQNPE